MFIILMFIIVVISEIIISNTIVGVTEYKIEDLKVSPSFNNFRIVQISDLHSKEFGTRNKILIHKIKKVFPDIIVLTGDMVNTKDKDFNIFYNFINQLVDIAPIYFVVGNHEQNLDEAKLKEIIDYLHSKGIIVLDNQKEKINRNGEFINIYGLWYNLRYYRDLKNEYSKDIYFGIDKIEKILGKADKAQFNLLLTHNPVYFETYAFWGADLTLCGHLHGGMIRIPFYGGLFSPEKVFFPKYDAGLFKIDNHYMIVNRGLGNGDLGFRFLNNPEIGLIILKNK